VRSKHPERRTALTVPLHRELKRGTLAGILSDAGIETEHFRQLLG
jgi:predicted RNA binding protein YcfA (HicA-like mRNA interferase family)